MNFIVRAANTGDLPSLLDLAAQFSLLNLPPNKSVITQKIENSIASFSGEVEKEAASYLFVIEDLHTGQVAGCSQIKGKHGTADTPTYSFKVIKKEKFSRDLGIGFIHQILRLHINTNGPSEIGGLIVNKAYRQRPEKIGKIISLARFLYIGMNLNRFEKETLAEMAPPLTEEGRSEFWESLGRRFTGMPYQEADALSHQNKEFIRSLFPDEDIYLCLLDAKARLVLGRVAEATQPAMHLLQNVGFTYRQEVDPFDGGPHLSVKTKEISVIKNGYWAKVASEKKVEFNETHLLAVQRDGEFFAGSTALVKEGQKIILPSKTMEALNLSVDEKVYISPSPTL